MAFFADICMMEGGEALARLTQQVGLCVGPPRDRNWQNQTDITLEDLCGPFLINKEQNTLIWFCKVRPKLSPFCMVHPAAGGPYFLLYDSHPGWRAGRIL